MLPPPREDDPVKPLEDRLVEDEFPDEPEKNEVMEEKKLPVDELAIVHSFALACKIGRFLRPLCCSKNRCC